MENKILFILFFFLFYNLSVAQTVYTNIPDPNFERALSAFDDIPGDGQVPTASIRVIESLDLSPPNFLLNINNLTGIEDFDSLKVLNCSNRFIEILDLRGVLSLETLICHSSGIRELNLTENTLLKKLDCSINPLNGLNLSNNKELIQLNCSGNFLGSIDLTHCKDLEWLSCRNNNLTSIDLSENKNLKIVSVSLNKLKTFDVSSNNKLTFIQCNNNKLEQLDLKNGANDLLVANTSKNPTLLCIEVDNEDAANKGIGPYKNWIKDETATYSESCNILNTNDITADPIVVFYPNPSQGILNFSGNMVIDRARVFSIDGKLIKTFDLHYSNSKKIDLTDFPNGIYFIHISNKKSQNAFSTIRMVRIYKN